MLNSLSFQPHLSGHRPSYDETVPGPLLNSLRADLGDQVVGSKKDERLQTLHGYYIDNLRIDIGDAAAVLGSDWKEEKSNNFFVHRFALEKGDSRQSISFDRKKGITTVTSRNGDRDHTLTIRKPRHQPSHHGYSDGKRRG